jgi:hypothetical protein
MGLFSIIGKTIGATKYGAQVTAYLNEKNPAVMQVVYANGMRNFFIDFCWEAQEAGAPIKECADLFIISMLSGLSFNDQRKAKQDFERKNAEKGEALTEIFVPSRGAAEQPEKQVLDALEPPPAPAPPRLTNEQHEAQVYKIIMDKTGINYQEAFKMIGGGDDEILRRYQEEPDQVADDIIKRWGPSVECCIEELISWEPNDTPKNDFIPYREIMERREGKELSFNQLSEAMYSYSLRVNKLVFDITGLNYDLILRMNENKGGEFDDLIKEDFYKVQSPPITAGKAIERFKGRVLANFMSLTGIAPGMVVR